MKFIYKSQYLFLLLMSFAMFGCTHAKTWELEHLKKPEMSLHQDPLEQKVSDHIDQSKETATSVSIGSSGCSCY